LASTEPTAEVWRRTIGHFLSLLFALTAFSLNPTLRAAEPESTPSEWKLISNKDGVALYRRDRQVTNESTAIGEIAAPAAVVHAVLNDVESSANRRATRNTRRRISPKIRHD